MEVVHNWDAPLVSGLHMYKVHVKGSCGRGGPIPQVGIEKLKIRRKVS